MARNNFIGPLAITSRRRAVTTTLIYGLSLTVRLTSATGEQTEIPSPAALSPNPMTSIMINQGARTFSGDWPPQPDAFVSRLRVFDRCRK
jgi:hypothetical protein